MVESRIDKSVKNAKINFVFYFVFIALSFFSRKIFLDTLGAEFMGLSGTLGNILGLLNIAEMGISASIGFHLYRPLHDDDHETTNELISLFGWFYRIVGCVIIVAAIIVSLFFPLIFKESTLSLSLIYFVFFSFLMSSLIGYFINYRQLLLGSDQKQYIVSKYLQTAYVVKTIVQMVVCYYFLNYYFWAIVEFLFALIGCILLNWKIDKTYPWLHSHPREGKRLNKKHPSVLKSAKQVFIHNLKSVFIDRCDQIFIFAFATLSHVAFYGNYSLIFSKLNALFGTLMGSVTASIGSVLADNNHERSMEIFWEQQAVRFLFAGVGSVSLFFLVHPLLSVWLGAEYILSDFLLFLFCLDFFLTITCNAVCIFLHCLGMYADIWTVWVTIILNLSVTIITGTLIGIEGVLLGKLSSLILVVSMWKPYYLFRDGFHEPYSLYWRHCGVYYLLLVISILIVIGVVTIWPWNAYSSWAAFIGYCFGIGGTMLISYFILMFFFGKGLRGFTMRLLGYYKIK